MTMRIIIPAAGRATRFNGVRKELLPLSEESGDTPIARAVRRAYSCLGAQSVVVVSTVDAICDHARALSDYAVDYRIQRIGGDLWGAIVTGGLDSAGGIVLPDTVWESAPAQLVGPITFGTFLTEEPARFSVLRDDTIATKADGPAALAWGCVLWDRATAEGWADVPFAHYDDAFRQAMAGGYATFPIDDYEDLGTFAAYRRWIAR